MDVGKSQKVNIIWSDLENIVTNFHIVIMVVIYILLHNPIQILIKTVIQVLQTPVRVENSIVNFYIVTTGVYVTTIYATKLQSKLTMTIRDVTKSSSRQTMFTVKNSVCVSQVSKC